MLLRRVRYGRTASVLLALLSAVLLSSATAAQAAVTGGTVSPDGPDVSGWQHPGGASINWQAVAGAGQTFAFVKATEGAGYANPYFRADWAGIAAAGMARGAYHYARPAYPLSTAVDQARAFLAVTGTMQQQGDMPPALDMEEAGSLSPGDLAQWSHLFLDTVQQATGRLPIIYTYSYFWQHSMGGNTGFTRYPLWIADYSGGAGPGLVGGWTSWTLWQYTANGYLPGISGPVDLSRYCCGASLSAFASGGSGGSGALGGSAILARWAELGGAGSYLGPVTSAEYAVTGGRAQNFRGGSIYWSAGTGAHVILGLIREHYWALGGSVTLGLPVTDETTTPDGLGRYNHFTGGGSMYWTPGTGAHLVQGAIMDLWAAQAWESGPLSYPLTDETPTPDGVGRYNHFAGGSVYWTPGTGAHSVGGAIRADWAARGWELSSLGYPTSNEYAVPGGAQSDFQNGGLRWTAATNTVALITR